MTRSAHSLGSFVAAAALAVAAVLASAAASAEIRYVPVPRSTLVSKRDLPFQLSQERRGEESVTTLVYEPAGANVAVASIHESSSSERVRVDVRLLAGAIRPELQLATLENLYVLLLRRDAVASYSFGDRLGLSQGEVLAQLAATRERANPAVPWEVVSMLPAPARSTDDDDVAARVVNGKFPMEGVTVYFSRAPHSGCQAKTAIDGVAACRLVDQHGDDHDDDKAAVVATFPGEVRPDRVLAPTTAVVRAP